MTAGGCGSTAVSHDSWITITSGSSGSANGVVTFSVAPNTSPVSRIGSMTIAGETFTVTQAGVSSAFSIGSISPNSGSVSGGTSITLYGGGFVLFRISKNESPPRPRNEFLSVHFHS